MSIKKITEIVDRVQMGDYAHCGNSIVGMDEGGYYVTDNGEEVEGLTREATIQIVYENENS